MSARTTSRRMFARTLAIGTLATLALAGCGGDGDGDGDAGSNGADPAAAESLDLDGKTFTATEVTGWVIVTDSTIKLTFDDGRISADAGCNVLNADASWEGGALALQGPLASTMKACPAGLEAQDQWLTKLLESSPKITADGESIVIGGGSNSMTMTEAE